MDRKIHACYIEQPKYIQIQSFILHVISGGDFLLH